MTRGARAWSAVALLHLLAWGSARTTIYTLTNRRIVLRVGMAVPKCINLPLGKIAAVDLATRARRIGRRAADADRRAASSATARCGRMPGRWRIARPQPMLRAVPDAATVAALIARTCLAANPDGRIAAAEAPARPMPAFAAGAGGMSAHDHADMLPRGTLVIAGALVLFALAATGMVRIDRHARPPPRLPRCAPQSGSPPVASRDAALPRPRRRRGGDRGRRDAAAPPR